MMLLTLTRTFFALDSINDAKKEHVLNNNVVELERPMEKKAKKAKWKASTGLVEDIVELFKMKYTLLEQSHAQETYFFYLKEEKMHYDREREEHKT